MWGTEDQELVTVADAPTPNPNLADRIDMTRDFWVYVLTGQRPADVLIELANEPTRETP